MIMKKTVFLLFLMAAVLGAPSAKAQVVLDTMDVPFGTFESWDSYPADSLSLMGGMISLPVNYDYELPTGWNVPLYNFNDNLNYSGLVIPVNLSLPVAVVYPDTMLAPEGNRGVVARTFRFQDVVTPTAYAMAADLLDSTLTSMVLPSVLLTGQINLDSIIPLIEQIVGVSEDLSWMLRMVDSVDLNNYLSGGFALNGFRPGKLIGKFIYRDPGEGDEDDCAAVIMIGTRYDTLQHRRVLVGAGVKRLYELYDSVNYEPFEFDYTSLSSYYPESYGYYEADSMVVMVVSSVADKGFQYGSRLYLDQLQLVSQPNPCGRVEGLRVIEPGDLAQRRVKITVRNFLPVHKHFQLVHAVFIGLRESQQRHVITADVRCNFIGPTLVHGLVDHSPLLSDDFLPIFRGRLFRRDLLFRSLDPCIDVPYESLVFLRLFVFPVGCSHVFCWVRDRLALPQPFVQAQVVRCHAGPEAFRDFVVGLAGLLAVEKKV